MLTNTPGGQLPELELRHRRHARVEDRIRNAKDVDAPSRDARGWVKVGATPATPATSASLAPTYVSALVALTGRAFRAENRFYRSGGVGATMVVVAR